MTEAELLQKLGVPYTKLPGHLDASTPDEFEKQLRKIFSQPEARQAKGVVYVWATEKGIPRLRGESNVIYIGKTKDSLCDRYRSLVRRIRRDCWDRYDHIMRTYGTIYIHYSMVVLDDQKIAEAKMLNWYAEKHLEIPPANGKH